MAGLCSTTGRIVGVVMKIDHNSTVKYAIPVMVRLYRGGKKSLCRPVFRRKIYEPIRPVPRGI
jgi:hypothetical protein